MELNEAMKLKNFVVVGNTINEDKVAYKIKNELLKYNYNVRCVGKELESINDVDFDIDVIDLCINPVLGLKLMKENKKSFKTVIVQPGALDEDLLNYFKENNIDFIDGCVSIGIQLYS